MRLGKNLPPPSGRIPPPPSEEERQPGRLECWKSTPIIFTTFCPAAASTSLSFSGKERWRESNEGACDVGGMKGPKPHHDYILLSYSCYFVAPFSFNVSCRASPCYPHLLNYPCISFYTINSFRSVAGYLSHLSLSWLCIPFYILSFCSAAMSLSLRLSVSLSGLHRPSWPSPAVAAVSEVGGKQECQQSHVDTGWWRAGLRGDPDYRSLPPLTQLKHHTRLIPHSMSPMIG